MKEKISDIEEEMLLVIAVKRITLMKNRERALKNRAYGRMTIH